MSSRSLEQLFCRDSSSQAAAGSLLRVTLLLSFSFLWDSQLKAKSLTPDDTQHWLPLDVKLDGFGDLQAESFVLAFKAFRAAPPSAHPT